LPHPLAARVVTPVRTILDLVVIVPVLASLVVFFLLTIPPPPPSTLFPYTTLFRSAFQTPRPARVQIMNPLVHRLQSPHLIGGERSEEHTSELQSRENLVCRLLLEKKKIKWHPWANLLGLHTAYQLDRVGGRYDRLE